MTFLKKTYLCIFGRAGSSPAVCGLSLIVVCGGYSSLGCKLGAFSLRRLLLLWSIGSRVCKLSSCGVWTNCPGGMWNLPRAGIKPVSPALACRLLTTGPPGKPTDGLNNVNVGR